jgi:hypothetical protein
MGTRISDVAGDTSTLMVHPLPSVEGVPKERVATSTLYLLERLFPGQHGIDFLARLLRHAQQKQLVLPEMGPDITDVAVITVQSLRTLAHLINLSYDTTEKYVVTLCHLRLLYKQRRRRQIILHFPLCAPTFPEPEALTPLTDYRSKVATFARQVKHRLLQLLEQGELPSPSSLVPLSALPMATTPDGDALFNALCQAVSQEVDAETAQRLVIRIRHVFQYHCQSRPTPSKGNFAGNEIAAQAQKATLPASKGGLLPTSLEAPAHQSRLPLPKGDSDCLHADDTLPTPSQKSSSVNPSLPKGGSDCLHADDALPTPSQKSPSADPSLPKGNSDCLHADDALPTPSQKSPSADPSLPKGGSDCLHADDALPTPSQKSPSADPSLPKGDFSASALLTQSRPSSPKGDSFLPVSAHQKATLSLSSPIQSRHTAPKDDSVARKGDSEQCSRDILPANVNVKKILETITTFNVSIAARFCCQLFDEPMTKQGIYAKLFRDIEYDTSAITAALFYTLVHRRDGTIQKPAAVFIQRCKDYHRAGIPDEAAQLVEHYGQLPYAAMVEAMKAPITSAPGLPSVAPGSSAPVQQSGPAYVVPSSLPPRVARSVPIRISLRANGGMTYEQVKRLFAEVTHDRRVALCTPQVVQLADHSYALMLDNTVSQVVRQTVFYSEREWQERTKEVTDCFALFESESSPGAARPSLREWIKQEREARQRKGGMR